MGAPSLMALKAQVERACGRRDAVSSKLTQTEAAISRLETEEATLTLVAELFRRLIDQEVNLSVQAVEKLMGEGLQAVFPDMQISVKPVVEIQRGKVSVDLVTSQDHGNGSIVEGSSPDTFGGSVTTVQSILLRMMLILQRGLRPVLFLDETLPAFDGNYTGNVGTFLALLCKKLGTGVDILLVTHNDALTEAAHHAYRISRKDGVASFEQLR